MLRPQRGALLTKRHGCNSRSRLKNNENRITKQSKLNSWPPSFTRLRRAVSQRKKNTCGIEVLELRRKTEQLTHKRVESETKIQKELDAASLAVVLRARNEAEVAHKSELNRLQNEEQAMRTALAQVALKRAETEAARQDEEAGLVQLADERRKLEDAQLRRSEEVRRLQSEAEERIRAQEETLQAQLKEMRQQAEKERARLEAEIGELLETEKRRLEETLERAEDEKQRITAELQGLLEEEERRIAELEATRKQIEAEAAAARWP